MGFSLSLLLPNSLWIPNPNSISSNSNVLLRVSPGNAQGYKEIPNDSISWSNSSPNYFTYYNDGVGSINE